MICFTILKEFVLISCVCAQPPGWSLVASFTPLTWVDKASIPEFMSTHHQTTRFILKEWDLSTPGRKPGCNTTQRGIKDLVFLLFSITPFFTPAPFSPLFSFHCLYTCRGGKSQAFLCLTGGTRGCGRQPQSRSCLLLRQPSCCFTDLWAFLFISSFCCLRRHRWGMNCQWQVKLKRWDEYVWHAGICGWKQAASLRHWGLKDTGVSGDTGDTGLRTLGSVSLTLESVSLLLFLQCWHQTFTVSTQAPLCPAYLISSAVAKF